MMTREEIDKLRFKFHTEYPEFEQGMGCFECHTALNCPYLTRKCKDCKFYLPEPIKIKYDSDLVWDWLAETLDPDGKKL